MTLVPTLKLSLEMTNVLTRIEMNGLKVNLDTLDKVAECGVFSNNQRQVIKCFIKITSIGNVVQNT